MFSSGATKSESALMILEAGLVASARFDMREATLRVNSCVPNRQSALLSSTSAARANPRWFEPCTASLPSHE